ncbi:CRE-INX-11 protein, partial [Aphelenchoides avenae]
YAENYCWAQDTYFLPPNVHVAQISDEERYAPERKLSYYQWVPFFLLLQAACFRAPSFLWKCFSINSGIRIHDVVRRATDPANMEEVVRAKNVDVLTKHISHALKFQEKASRRKSMLHGMLRALRVTCSACFISFMYLVTKAIFLINVLVQLYLMNKFLETEGHEWFGFGVLRDLVAGVPWESSGYFPRVRQVANIQKYSIQCVLVINIFNEKIFILLWFWYTFLLFATLASFVYWTVLTSFPCFGRGYIASALEVSNDLPPKSKQTTRQLNRFVDDYLKQDGVFVLRMIQLHAGALFGSELIGHLYDTYLEIANRDQSEKKQPLDHHQVQNNANEYLRQRKKEGKDKTDPTDVITHLLPASRKDEDASSASTSSPGSSPPTEKQTKIPLESGTDEQPNAPLLQNY